MLIILCLLQRYFPWGSNQSSQTAFPLEVREDSTLERNTGLTRGSVCFWCKVCMLGKGKHTDIRGQMHESPRMNLSEVSHRYATK